ncbi:MAG: DUF5986 family protein [Veillonellales bacterium]
MEKNINDKLILQNDLLRRIVYAVNKAVEDDIPDYLKEQHHETNNAIPHLKGDYINDNLRNNVVKENIELIPFKRYGWSGRIIIDHVNHVTYTITTLNTLVGIPRKKERRTPHYLQSILYAENSGCQAPVKQTCLDLGITQFSSEELEEDYNSITNGLISKEDDYRHYIIAYKSEGNEIVEIILKLLDRDFDAVDEVSLMEYIKPDYARLTDIEDFKDSSKTAEEPDHKGLVAVKAGLKPNLKDTDKPVDL